MTPPWTGRTIGLALGSGGSKGFAHVGVLRVVEELGIEPDIVTGTSIGSMIGAFWCAGYRAADIEEIVFSDAPKRLRSSGPPAITEHSLLDEGKIVAWLKELLPARFDQLDRRFACVSTDLLSGKPLLHDTGDLAEAIRGSISIPGFFIARETDEHLIVDGGITEPVPVFAAKQLGADYVIAVTLTVLRDRGLAMRKEAWRRSDKVHAWNKPGAPGARMEELFGSIDVMAARLSDLALAEADVAIKPRLDQYTVVTAYQQGSDVLAEGERAAREVLEPLA